MRGNPDSGTVYLSSIIKRVTSYLAADVSENRQIAQSQKYRSELSRFLLIRSPPAPDLPVLLRV